MAAFCPKEFIEISSEKIAAGKKEVRMFFIGEIELLHKLQTVALTEMKKPAVKAGFFILLIRLVSWILKEIRICNDVRRGNRV